MSRAELVTSLAYDMATVSRLKENIDQVLSVFDIRNTNRMPITAHRFICACFYFGICRLMYPSGLTLGEELVELVPSGNPRLKPTQRLKWYLATMIPHFILMYRSESPIMKLVKTLLSEVWFSVISKNPGSTTLVEEVIKPASFRPVCVHPKSGLLAPAWLFPAYGVASGLKAIMDFLQSRLKVDYKPRAILEVKTRRLLNGQPCVICMEPINVYTATVCGHVFCWDCILDWCVSGEQDAEGGVPCPTCRTSCRPSDLVPLVNYAPSGSTSAVWTRPIILNSDS
jgi:hypothetical protein